MLIKEWSVDKKKLEEKQEFKYQHDENDRKIKSLELKSTHQDSSKHKYPSEF